MESRGNIDFNLWGPAVLAPQIGWLLQGIFIFIRYWRSCSSPYKVVTKISVVVGATSIELAMNCALTMLRLRNFINGESSSGFSSTKALVVTSLAMSYVTILTSLAFLSNRNLKSARKLKTVPYPWSRWLMMFLGTTWFICFAGGIGACGAFGSLSLSDVGNLPTVDRLQGPVTLARVIYSTVIGALMLSTGVCSVIIIVNRRSTKNNAEDPNAVSEQVVLGLCLLLTILQAIQLILYWTTKTAWSYFIGTFISRIYAITLILLPTQPSMESVSVNSSNIPEVHYLQQIENEKASAPQATTMPQIRIPADLHADSNVCGSCACCTTWTARLRDLQRRKPIQPRVRSPESLKVGILHPPVGSNSPSGIDPPEISTASTKTITPPHSDKAASQDSGRNISTGGAVPEDEVEEDGSVAEREILQPDAGPSALAPTALDILNRRRSTYRPAVDISAPPSPLTQDDDDTMSMTEILAMTEYGDYTYYT